ncbi:MAG: hypothetical protein ACJ8CR_23350 [Roseiflexaceae bacterium]
MPQSAHPPVPEMLGQLEQAYGRLIALHAAPAAEVQRLLTVLDDFRWYGERLGANRWEGVPRPGRWSFAENLWHITEQATAAGDRPDAAPLRYFIDHGKEHVGQAAELLAIFAYDEGQAL